MKTMLTGQEMEPLSPVSWTKIIKHVKPSTPTAESFPFEGEVPIQEDLEAPVAEPAFIALKESAVPIVEEPSL